MRVSVLADDEIFYLLGSFIVEAVEGAFEAPRLAPFIHLGVGTAKFRAVPRLDGNGLNVVCIEDIKYTDLFVPAVRHPWKYSRLVDGYPFISQLGSHEDVLCLCVAGFLFWHGERVTRR